MTAPTLARVLHYRHDQDGPLYAALVVADRPRLLPILTARDVAVEDIPDDLVRLVVFGCGDPGDPFAATMLIDTREQTAPGSPGWCWPVTVDTPGPSGGGVQPDTLGPGVLSQATHSWPAAPVAVL